MTVGQTEGQKYICLLSENYSVNVSTRFYAFEIITIQIITPLQDQCLSVQLMFNVSLRQQSRIFPGLYHCYAHEQQTLQRRLDTVTGLRVYGVWLVYL